MLPMTTTSTSSESDDHSADSAEATVYVFGDGHLGSELARRLRAVGRNAVKVGEGDRLNDIDALDSDATVVAATHSDARNLMVAQ